MSDVESTPDAVSRTGFNGLPRWLRIGIIAAATAVVVLVIAVIIRILLQTPLIPLGPTAVDDLMPGACVVESGQLETYTVVSCSTHHHQQVIAKVDLAFPGVPYSADSSLATYAGYTCDRLLEYRLYLVQDMVKTEYKMAAISPPTLEQYQGGETVTLCAVYDNPKLPDDGGESEDLTRDLYRPMPK